MEKFEKEFERDIEQTLRNMEKAINYMDFAKGIQSERTETYKVKVRKIQRDLERQILQFTEASSDFDTLFDYVTDIAKTKSQYIRSALTLAVPEGALDKCYQIANEKGTEAIREKMDQYMMYLTKIFTATYIIGSPIGQAYEDLTYRIKKNMPDEARAIIFIMYYSVFIETLVKDERADESFEKEQRQLREMILKLEESLPDLKEVCEKNRKLTVEIAELKQEITASENAKALRSQLYDVQKENEELKEKLEALTKEYDAVSADNKVLNELLEEFDAISSEEKDETGSYTEEIGEDFFQRRFMFIGGFEAVIGRLKDKFINSVFIENERTKVTPSMLEKYEYVVYLTNFLGHPMYNKYRSLSKACSIKELHVPSVGESAIIEDLRKKILEGGKRNDQAV